MAKAITLRAGVIGCGKVARTLHLAEYVNSDYTDLVAYCDVD